MHELAQAKTLGKLYAIIGVNNANRPQLDVVSQLWAIIALTLNHLFVLLLPWVNYINFVTYKTGEKQSQITGVRIKWDNQYKVLLSIILRLYTEYVGILVTYTHTLKILQK